MKNKSLVKFLSTTPWAMEPNRLEVLQQVVADHISGANVQVESSEEEAGYEVNSNVAIIPIEGTIKKRNYGLDALSGARTTLDIAEDIKKAESDPNIHAILFNVDSPGGTVAGTKELADLIKSTNKPTVAYADGMMCSAAMWLASAADYIIGYDTSTIGSIGVIMTHQDWSKAEEEAGLKTTHIYAGKYKAYGNSSEPLSDESREYIQTTIDKLYTMFVNDIAENRNLKVSYVLENIATAATFLAEEAKDLKLIDAVGNFQDALQIAQQLGGDKMTLEELQEKVEALEADKLKAEEAANAAQAKIEAMEEAKAQEAKEVKIKSLFADAKVEEDFVASFFSQDEMIAKSVAETLVAKQQQLDELLAEHTEPEGHTTQHEEPIVYDNLDEAVTAIMDRDNCDVEEAADKAIAEFPELIK